MSIARSIPNWSVLPEAQRALVPALSALPEGFVLYGETAIALRLGHRESVNFDFLIRATFEPELLYQEIAQPPCPFDHAEVLQLAANTLTLRTRSGVRLSCFGVPRLPLIHEPTRLAGFPTPLGDLRELAGMKALVVQKRAEAKDYLDVHALIRLAGIPLRDMLISGSRLYGELFNPTLTLKSLCYFDDGDLGSLPQGIRRDLRRAVREASP